MFDVDYKSVVFANLEKATKARWYFTSAGGGSSIFG